MSTLDISPDLALPLEAVTETFAILAVKRAGKSNAAVVLAEEMYDAGIPWVAIDPKGDWWGVRAADNGNEKGLAVLVFGGLHSDVPLEPTAGRLVADLIVEQRITAVLDVSEMTKADQRRFLTEFTDRLYRTNTEPLHVFCEEADEYIPQRVMGENAKLVGAFETLVKRGGFRGIGVTLITQRSASLNKDVLTQAGTLFAMRTPSAQDRKAVKAWIDFHAASDEMLADLPTLSAGEAWVFSPEWLRTVQRIRFRRRRTFDSGATPKVGETRRTPTNLADVDLAAIKEAMAETIERAKADDPKTLRARIRDLEQQLANRPEPEPVEVQVLDVALVEELRTHVREAERGAQAVIEQTIWLRTTLDALIEQEGGASGREDVPRTRPTGDGPRPVERPRAAERPDRTGGRQPSRPAVQGSAGAADIGKGERTILTAVAQYNSGVTREQLTVLTGYKRSSRDTYLQRLRQAGLVATGPGGMLVATDEGILALGDGFEPLPTGQALREHRLARLPEGERRILAHLIDAWPAVVERDELSEVTGYKRSSRDTYLQRLRARQLVTTDGNPRAADTLFDGGTR